MDKKVRSNNKKDIRNPHAIASLLKDGVDSFDHDRKQFLFHEFPQEAVHQDYLNSLKTLAKQKLQRFYPLFIRLLSPVYGSDPIREFLKDYPATGFLSANLGAGTSNYPDVIALDGTGYENIDIVCDLSDLPFLDNCLDAVFSIAVLEHVPNPQQHVAEMLRVLKPGGHVVCFIPFLQPFHASPYDYQRYTREGIKTLFKDFQINVVEVGAGPTSSLVWVLQEWLAMALSFGSIRLYKLWVLLLLSLSPLKYFDIFFAKHPAAHVLASGFTIHARKGV